MTNCDQPLDLSVKKEKAEGQEHRTARERYLSESWPGTCRVQDQRSLPGPLSSASVPDAAVQRHSEHWQAMNSQAASSSMSHPLPAIRQGDSSRHPASLLTIAAASGHERSVRTSPGTFVPLYKNIDIDAHRTQQEQDMRSPLRHGLPYGMRPAQFVSVTESGSLYMTSQLLSEGSSREKDGKGVPDRTYAVSGSSSLWHVSRSTSSGQPQLSTSSSFPTHACIRSVTKPSSSSQLRTDQRLDAYAQGGLSAASSDPRPGHFGLNDLASKDTAKPQLPTSYDSGRFHMQSASHSHDVGRLASFDQHAGDGLTHANSKLNSGYPLGFPLSHPQKLGSSLSKKALDCRDTSANGGQQPAREREPCASASIPRDGRMQSDHNPEFLLLSRNACQQRYVNEPPPELRVVGRCGSVGSEKTLSSYVANGAASPVSMDHALGMSYLPGMHASALCPPRSRSSQLPPAVSQVIAKDEQTAPRLQPAFTTDEASVSRMTSVPTSCVGRVGERIIVGERTKPLGHYSSGSEDSAGLLSSGMPVKRHRHNHNNLALPPDFDPFYSAGQAPPPSKAKDWPGGRELLQLKLSVDSIAVSQFSAVPSVSAYSTSYWPRGDPPSLVQGLHQSRVVPVTSVPDSSAKLASRANRYYEPSAFESVARDQSSDQHCRVAPRLDLLAGKRGSAALNTADILEALNPTITAATAAPANLATSTPLVGTAGHTLPRAGFDEAAVRTQQAPFATSRGSVPAPGGMALKSLAYQASSPAPALSAPLPARIPYLTLAQAAAAATATAAPASAACADLPLTSSCSYRAMTTPLITTTSTAARVASKLIPVANVQPFFKNILAEACIGSATVPGAQASPHKPAHLLEEKPQASTSAGAEIANCIQTAGDSIHDEQRREPSTGASVAPEKLAKSAPVQGRVHESPNTSTGSAAHSASQLPEDRPLTEQIHSSMPEALPTTDDAVPDAAAAMVKKIVLANLAQCDRLDSAVDKASGSNLFKRLSQFKKDYSLHPKKRPYVVEHELPCGSGSVSRRGSDPESVLPPYSGKRKKRSLLDEIANTEGYVAESERMPDKRRKLRTATRQSFPAGLFAANTFKQKQRQLRARTCLIEGASASGEQSDVAACALKGWHLKAATQMLRGHKRRSLPWVVGNRQKRSCAAASSDEMPASTPSRNSVSLSASRGLANTNDTGAGEPRLTEAGVVAHAAAGYGTTFRTGSLKRGRSCSTTVKERRRSRSAVNQRNACGAARCPSSLALTYKTPTDIATAGAGASGTTAMPAEHGRRTVCVPKVPCETEEEALSATENAEFEFSSFYLPVYHNEEIGHDEFVLVQDVLHNSSSLINRERLEAVCGAPNIVTRDVLTSLECSTGLDAHLVLRDDITDPVELVPYTRKLKRLLGIKTETMRCSTPDLLPCSNEVPSASAVILSDVEMSAEQKGNSSAVCKVDGAESAAVDSCSDVLPCREWVDAKVEKQKQTDISAGKPDVAQPSALSSKFSEAVKGTGSMALPHTVSQPTVTLQRLRKELVVSCSGDGQQQDVLSSAESAGSMAAAPCERRGSAGLVLTRIELEHHLSGRAEACSGEPAIATANAEHHRLRNHKNLTLSLPLSLPLTYCHKSGPAAAQDGSCSLADDGHVEGDDSSQPQLLTLATAAPYGDSCVSQWRVPMQYEEQHPGRSTLALAVGCGMPSALALPSAVAPPSAVEECSMPTLTPVYTDDKMMTFSHF